MDWSDVKSFIGKAAPVLGAALGPAGSVVGGLISSALGTSNTPDAVMTELQGNPDAILKLQQLETSHSEFLANLVAQQNLAQVGVDQTAEAGPGLLGKWRDGAGWLCVFALGWATIGQSLLSWAAALWFPQLKIPEFDTTTLTTLLFGMLGLTGAHMAENIKGADHV